MATRKSGRKPKMGSGRRFKNLSNKLARKGARDPDALAASIGRKSLGRKRMARLAATGRRRAARRRKR